VFAWLIDVVGRCIRCWILLLVHFVPESRRTVWSKPLTMVVMKAQTMVA
jgi:hypothetical protein